MRSFTSNFALLSSSRYKLSGRLIGHPESIHAVAVSKDGSVLASGGESLLAVVKPRQVDSGGGSSRSSQEMMASALEP